jgi:hypothetical protein
VQLRLTAKRNESLAGRIEEVLEAVDSGELPAF